jgi:SPP1 family predicted phage head-tail adaptor
MNIGNLRERVQVERATAKRDDFGSETLAWNNVATVWAQVLERGGREPVLADRPVMLVSYEVTVRAGLAITNKDRLVWRGKVLAIDTVTPLPADGLIILRCMEATA